MVGEYSAGGRIHAVLGRQIKYARLRAQLLQITVAGPFFEKRRETNCLAARVGHRVLVLVSEINHPHGAGRSAMGELALSGQVRAEITLLDGSDATGIASLGRIWLLQRLGRIVRSLPVEETH